MKRTGKINRGDPITMIIRRLEHFSTVMVSPAQVKISAAVSFDITSGPKVDELLAAARTKSLRKLCEETQGCHNFRFRGVERGGFLS